MTNKEKTNMGTEEQFETLHGLVTSEFISRIKAGESSTADLRAACEWLKTNGITGIPVDDSPLADLLGLIPELSFEDVQSEIT
jgi:hypothetical protein